MRKFFPFITAIFFLSFLSSCLPDPIACTEEFVIVSIQVNGATLDDHYTIWHAKEDTFTLTSGIDNIYAVVDDSFQEQLEGKTEEFSFIGIINDTIVIDELYVVSANECHIERISGVIEVNL